MGKLWVSYHNEVKCSHSHITGHVCTPSIKFYQRDIEKYYRPKGHFFQLQPQPRWFLLVRKYTFVWQLQNPSHSRNPAGITLSLHIILITYAVYFFSIHCHELLNTKFIGSYRELHIRSVTHPPKSFLVIWELKRQRNVNWNYFALNLEEFMVGSRKQVVNFKIT